MTPMTPEEAYVARQWPKRCGCGRAYTSLDHFRANTDFVPAVKGPNPIDDEFGLTELRNCQCGTTLSAVTLVKDLTKE